MWFGCGGVYFFICLMHVFVCVSRVVPAVSQLRPGKALLVEEGMTVSEAAKVMAGRRCVCVRVRVRMCIMFFSFF